MTAPKVFASSGFGSNGVTSRSLGVPAAAYPGRVATNSDLIVAVDRQQTTLLLPLGPGDTTMTVLDASSIVGYNLLSIDNEIVKTTGPPGGNVVPILRGFDGTTAALHAANAVVSGLIDAWHHNALVAEVEAIEAFLGPHGSNLPNPVTPATATTLGGVKIGANVSVQPDGTISVAAPVVVSTQYIFPPQTPGGTLAPGNQVITLTPVPKGVNGTDQNHYLYISGGTGTAEAALITGGTAVSGAASGTVIVNCANSHSGAWTIQSASAGIFEAYIANPWRKIYVPAGHWMMYAPLNFDWAKSLTLVGDGYDWANNSGTMLDFAALTSATPAIALNNTSGTGTLNVVKFQDIGLSGTFSPSGGHGIYLNNANRVCISGVQVIGFAGDGIHMTNCLEVTIQDKSNIMYSGQWGIYATGSDLMGFLVISDSYVNWNGRKDSFGNIALYGSGTALMGQITLMNVDCEQAGQQPFPSTTITTAYALFAGFISTLCIMNSDFEVGAGPNLVSYGPFSGTINNLTEFNNSYVGNQILYSPNVANVKSWGNTYYGTTCFRTFQATNRVGYDIGPDSAGNGSPEPANHPRLLGLPGVTGAGTPLLGANSPATVLTAPFTWLQTQGPQGNTLYIPAWK